MFGEASGEATVTIAAPPDLVYGLVSDVTRMGDWSPECTGGRWIDGATGPSVGARFSGENRLGPRRWTTTPVVTAASAGREFAFSVMVRDREATRWRYVLRPVPEGTVVTESFEYVWAPWPYAVGNFLLRRHRMLRRGLRITLERLKEAAEANASG